MGTSDRDAGIEADVHRHRIHLQKPKIGLLGRDSHRIHAEGAESLTSSRRVLEDPAVAFVTVGYGQGRVDGRMER